MVHQVVKSFFIFKVRKRDKREVLLWKTSIVQLKESFREHAQLDKCTLLSRNNRHFFVRNYTFFVYTCTLYIQCTWYLYFFLRLENNAIPINVYGTNLIHLMAFLETKLDYYLLRNSVHYSKLYSLYSYNSWKLWKRKS